MKTRVLLLIFPFYIFACKQSKEVDKIENGEALIQYSKKLQINKIENYYKARVKNPNSSDSSYFTYILYKGEKPAVKADSYIKIPVEKVICLSTSHLPAFAALDKKNAIAGFPNTSLIYNQELIELVKAGKIKDVGRKNGLNIEKTIELQADLIMGYALGSSMEQLQPIEKTGVPVILNLDYQENTPLGRAEWLKLTALLLDQYEAGDSLFQTIEMAYHKTKSSIENIKNKPTVMTGLMYGDVWYVAGGESFAAQFIEDAGGDYIWSDNAQTGSLELSFERVLSNAQNADYWIGAASFTSLEDLENNNNKYALFDAFQNQKVYSYTKRVNDEGSNDYLESGFMRADLVLKDYVNLLHPNVLTDSTTTYFEKLNP
jgi:iron complex transport system substrate-binding protein